MCCCGCMLFLEMEHQAQRMEAEVKKPGESSNTSAVPTDQPNEPIHGVRFMSWVRRLFAPPAHVLRTTPDVAR